MTQAEKDAKLILAKAVAWDALKEKEKAENDLNDAEQVYEAATAELHRIQIQEVTP